jgi:hypothetical protein
VKNQAAFKLQLPPSNVFLLLGRQMLGDNGITLKDVGVEREVTLGVQDCLVRGGLNSEMFKKFTSLDPLSTPISFNTYVENGFVPVYTQFSRLAGATRISQIKVHFQVGYRRWSMTKSINSLIKY